MVLIGTNRKASAAVCDIRITTKVPKSIFGTSSLE